MLLKFIVCFIAGIGAGLGTGFAGMSAAAVISPMLITFLGMPAYEAVGIALASDVLASAVSAYTYGKNKNLDIKNGLVMMFTVLLMTLVGSYVASLVPNKTMGNFSVFMTLLLGIKFIVKPVMTTKEKMTAVDPKKRVVQSILCGLVVGFICGFVGAGGGMMMLLILTGVLGYELKTAVGTSVFIMAFTAFTGSLSHFAIGGMPDILCLVFCVFSTLLWARIAALFANKASAATLNRATGFVLVILGILIISVSITTTPVKADDSDYTGWEVTDGNWYWYENGVKQGTEGRGKEIYDPGTQAWYWLDAVDGGKKAVGKDLYQESEAGDWAENSDGTGKWVRYDDEGHMVKGWDTNANGTYYFDLIYGTMAKGGVLIDGNRYTFDVLTGILQSDLNGWQVIDGVEYWYENGVRQGLEGRGKEIYDPGTDAWYWLDSIDNGKKAVSKDVYQESKADDAGNMGKWVRYDANGHMVKGWDTNANGTYYFDPVYGTMYKGEKVIDGKKYRFDDYTGIMTESSNICNLSETSKYYKYELAYRTGRTPGFSTDDYAVYKGLKACLDSAYSYDTMYEREKAVHDWIILNCAYDYDNYLNGTIPGSSYRIEGVFAKGLAVCEGYTESFKLCMDIIGIPCEKIYGTVNGRSHAWNAVKLEADWYMVDVTWGDPVPDEKGRVSYRYFNVTDEQLRKDHSFTSTVYAQGTKYNYFRQAVKTVPSDEEYVKQAKELFAGSNGFEEKNLRVMVYGKNEEEVNNKRIALTDKIDEVAMFHSCTWSSADQFVASDLYFATYTLKLTGCDNLNKCADYVSTWAATAKSGEYLYTVVNPQRVSQMTQETIEKTYFSGLKDLGVTFRLYTEVENGVNHYKLYFAKN